MQSCPAGHIFGHSHRGGLLPIPSTQPSFTNPGILADDARQFQVSFSARTQAPAPLKSILPSIGLTKHKLKQLESICLVREQRENCRQELAFNARPFVLCGLPLRRPPSTHLVHRRRNGRFYLHIVALRRPTTLTQLDNCIQKRSVLCYRFVET